MSKNSVKNDTVSAGAKTRKLPHNWQWSTLGEVCEIRRGTSITAKQTRKGKVPVIAGGRGPAYYHDEFNREGEIITVSGSGYAGFVNYFNEPIWASDCSTLQSPKDSRVLIRFVYYFMRSIQQKIYGLQRGAAQPHVYARDLVGIAVPIPSLDEQKHIVDLLDKQMAKVELAKMAASEQLEAIEAMPAALLRQVFGDISTPPPPPLMENNENA